MRSSARSVETIEAWDDTAFTFGVQFLDRICEIASDGAADATALQDGGLLIDNVDEEMIEANLTEFVDQNGCVGKLWRRQQPLQQHRLAAAEKTGDDIDGNEALLVRHPLNCSSAKSSL